MKYILVILDSSGKFAIAYSTRRATAEVVVKFLHKTFMQFGYPACVVSDNAKCFLAQKYKNFLFNHGVRAAYISSYHACSNMSERLNRNLKIYMACIIKQYALEHKACTKILPNFTFQYNNSYHTSIGTTPLEIFFKRRLITLWT